MNYRKMPEENIQYMTSIYLEYQENGVEVVSNYWDDILYIANQCPNAGGEAVYQARAFLSLVNDSLEYNDAFNCLQYGIYRTASQDNIPAKAKLHVKPNPANQNVEIIVDNGSELKSISIETIIGQQIFQKQVMTGQNKYNVDVSNLSPAMYILRVRLENGGVLSEKLIIKR